ncbi:MAG: ferric reductase-like transmembrane domain-containing protein [Anaerolineales bacterium]|nr:ferric reductase-like transmembrane domain-containing protein [Anaerolineales bacterium]
MTTLSNQPTFSNRLLRTLAFLVSLLVGMMGGTVILGSTWYLAANTAVGTQLVQFLGITEKTAWHFSRSAGTVAYMLLAGSTVWGLLLSSKLIKEAVPAALALAMHNILSWLAIALTGLHALALLFDSYLTYTLPSITIPFLGPYKPGWVGLGIIGFYLMFITAISFNFRKQIGQKRWRQMHYLSFVAYLGATIHGAMAGTDSGNPGMQALYWGSGLLVLFLTNFRLLAGKSGRG